MNASAALIQEQAVKELSELGPDSFGLKSVQNLCLKAVIKESHGSPTHQVVYNDVDPECRNLFATVGGNQATIYDGTHAGNSVAVVVQYINTKSEFNRGGDLRCCSWLSLSSNANPPQTDACLAVGGTDPVISIISILHTRVISQLKGHTKELAQLVSCRSNPKLLASLSRDHQLRLWDVEQQACLACASTEGRCMAFCPDGSSIVTGGKNLHGLQMWHVDDLLLGQAAESEVESSSKTSRAILTQQEIRLEGGLTQSDTICSILFLTDCRMCLLTIDGQCTIFDLKGDTSVASWMVPGMSEGGRRGARCQLSTACNGAFICVGNQDSEVFAYQSSTGRRLADLYSPKVEGPVWSCALSHDCRHLLAAVGNGYVLRFEYVKPESPPPENSEKDMRDVCASGTDA